jgi:hypothetical protein
MYLIDCYECRTKISDKARLCPKCGRSPNYARAIVEVDAPRTLAPRVISGRSIWSF